MKSYPLNWYIYINKYIFIDIDIDSIWNLNIFQIWKTNVAYVDFYDYMKSIYRNREFSVFIKIF